MTETTTDTLYCYVHPGRETSLRCNNCDRPICASCAVRTPTGYRCKECVKGHQQIFNTAEWYDYIIGFVGAAILSGIASFLVTLIGNIGFFGWIIIIVGAPTAAGIIAETLRYALRKRRARNLFITVAVGVVVGALPVILFQVFTFNIFGIIFQVVYLVIATPVVYTRLSGIQLFR
ncbi:MAG TPA: hypothetical protein DCX53_07930 [Anaerolineae bacterium]|nr:hypothetical protein [Anaerolineae bacterium]